LGSACAHGVCVLPVEGPTIVVVDRPYWRTDLVVADDVRFSVHVTETAVDAIRGLGLQHARLALVGANFMSAAAYLGLREGLAGAELVLEDRLVEDLRMHKSPAEIEVIRRAAMIG